MSETFERFTDRARRAVVLAKDHARILHHSYVGSEHLLLGLVDEEEGVAAMALGLNVADVERVVVELVGEGGPSPVADPPFTPRAKKMLEFSLREALQLGHNYVGTEHLLLGLLREGQGVAAQALTKLGRDPDVLRHRVLQILHTYEGANPEQHQQMPRPQGRQTRTDALMRGAVERLRAARHEVAAAERFLFSLLDGDQ